MIRTREAAKEDRIRESAKMRREVAANRVIIKDLARIGALHRRHRCRGEVVVVRDAV